MTGSFGLLAVGILCPPSEIGPVGSTVGIMNDSTLAKLVVTVIVLVGFAVWLKAERTESRTCGTNCATDISASRR
jgi:hypothetical protein